jgi:hypothetical protein
LKKESKSNQGEPPPPLRQALPCRRSAELFLSPEVEVVPSQQHNERYGQNGAQHLNS